MIPWSQTLVSANASSAAFTSNSAADLCPNWDYTFPAAFFAIGTKWRMHASGVVATTSSAATTLTFSVVLGSTIITQALGAITCVTSLGTATKWWLDIDVECRAVGAGTSTTFVGTGLFLTSTALLAIGFTPLPITGTIAAGTGVSSVATQTLTLQGVWSTAAGDSLTVEQYEVVLLQA